MMTYEWRWSKCVTCTTQEWITWPDEINLRMILDYVLELLIAKVLTLINETFVSGLVTLQGNTKSCPSFM